MIKLTDVEPNDIGFTRILSCAELYFNNIDSEVPIPKDCFGFIVSVTISPFSRPCEVDIEIVDLIFSTLAVSCEKLDSIEYLKSESSAFELNDLKNNQSIKSSFFATVFTSLSPRPEQLITISVPFDREGQSLSRNAKA